MVFETFVSENGFRLFPCWSGMVWNRVWFPQGTTGVCECQLSFQFQMNKIMWEIQNGFQEIFLPGSNLSNDRHYFCLCQV